jgi:hypothetical protein
MKKALLATAACAALGLVVQSQGAVVGSVVDKGVPTNGTSPAVGYHAYVLHLHSDTGVISAVDFSGSNGIVGANAGKLAQRWSSSGGDGTYDTPSPGFSTVNGSTNTAVNYDSHFLGVAANFVVGSALAEDGTFKASGQIEPGFPANSDSAGIGLGSFLRGAYGIVGAQQSADLDVAYVVTKDGGTPALPFATFTAQVATANGTFNVSGPIAVGIPEPATLSLAGLGVLGLVARRRRA